MVTGYDICGTCGKRYAPKNRSVYGGCMACYRKKNNRTTFSDEVTAGKFRTGFSDEVASLK